MSDNCVWEMVYQHGPNGQPIYGSKRDLVLAIKAGADVQVRYFRQEGALEWHRKVLNVSIFTPPGERSLFPSYEDSVVSAVIYGLPSTVAEGRTLAFDIPPAYEWKIFDTTGAVQSQKIDQKTSESEVDVKRIGLSWYVRGYNKEALGLFKQSIAYVFTPLINP